MEKEYCQNCGRGIDLEEKVNHITEDGFKVLCYECAKIEEAN
jgi:hypothetical protein